MFSDLTMNEQKSLMTLWCIFRNPLIFGGDMRHLLNDPATLALITNPEIIAVNQQGEHPKALVINQRGFYVWVSETSTNSLKTALKDVYVAVFNVYNSQTTNYIISLEEVTHIEGTVACNVRDLWASKDLGTFTDVFVASAPLRGVHMLLMSECK